MLAPSLAAASLCLALGLGPAPPGERVDLRWTGPPDCPASVFHAALARYLGPTDPAAPLFRVRAEVRAEGGRWHLDLDAADVADTAGTRRLTADRCEVVVDAAAFVVAQAMGDTIPPPPELPPVTDEHPPAPDPEPPSAAPEPPSVAPEPVAPELAEPSDAPPPATPPLPSRPRLRAALRLRGGLSGVALPGVTAAFGLVAGLVGPRWRVELTSLGRLPVRKAAADPAIGGRLAMWAVGARGCGVPGVQRLEFPLCAGLEVGQVLGRSDGLTPEGRARSVWAAVTAGSGLAWAPLPWLAVMLEAEVAVALVRHDWRILGLPRLHRLGPVDLRGFAGLEFRLGRKIP